jgi:anti-sigma factor RsiW
MMADPGLPPDDAELHAYADGLLEPARAEAVAAWLAADPAARERVAAWRRQNTLIRSLATDVPGEPFPPGLRPALLAQRLARRRRRERRRMAAAIALALVAGGGADWLAHARWRAETGPLDAPFLEDIAAYRLSAAAFDPSQDPDGDARDPEAVAERLSRWLDHPIVAPDLSSFGLRLVGARTARTEDADQVAVLAYEVGSASRFMLYLLQPAQPPTPVLHEAKGIAGQAVYWPYDELRCVLTGDAAPDRLQAMARAINTQIEEAEEK